jgi:lipid-binding SYLF domain-containing protein
MNGVAYAVGDDALFVEEPPACSDLNKQIANLTTGLQAIINEKIPTALMQQAKAVAVLDVTKFGFVIAIGSGKGLLVKRCPKCNSLNWSNPALITRSSASIGWQAGVEAKTVVLVFTDCEIVDKLMTGNLELGAGVDLSVGPLATEVGTDTVFDKKVYTYSDGVGLFAGVSLKGSSLALDPLPNKGLYGQEITLDELCGTVTPCGTAGAAVRNLKNLLKKASR